MNTLPKKREPGDTPEVNSIPTWRELADRFRDLMKDFLKEGKELERELRAEAPPGAETTAARDREAHREARGAGVEENRLDPNRASRDAAARDPPSPGGFAAAPRERS